MILKAEKTFVCERGSPNMCEKDAFTEGFCLGARIMIEVMDYGKSEE